MKVGGCFGDCRGETEISEERSKDTSKPLNVCFYPPIQTLFREKDPTKWYTDMINDIEALRNEPNRLTEYGDAPLCLAAHRAQGLVVETLLQNPTVNVNIKGKQGRTPLYLAAQEGHVYIVKILLRHPLVDVNEQNSPGGATALMAASRAGHGRVVDLLLRHPTTMLDATDREGNTAAQHARTASVRCRLSNHERRSRSLEQRRPSLKRNICHVSVDNSPEEESREVAGSLSPDSLRSSRSGEDEDEEEEEEVDDEEDEEEEERDWEDEEREEEEEEEKEKGPEKVGETRLTQPEAGHSGELAQGQVSQDGRSLGGQSQSGQSQDGQSLGGQSEGGQSHGGRLEGGQPEGLLELSRGAEADVETPSWSGSNGTSPSSSSAPCTPSRLQCAADRARTIFLFGNQAAAHLENYFKQEGKKAKKAKDSKKGSKESS